MAVSHRLSALPCPIAPPDGRNTTSFDEADDVRRLTPREPRQLPDLPRLAASAVPLAALEGIEPPPDVAGYCLNPGILLHNHGIVLFHPGIGLPHVPPVLGNLINSTDADPDQASDHGSQRLNLGTEAGKTLNAPARMLLPVNGSVWH